jgi:hypothetical protein
MSTYKLTCGCVVDRATEHLVSQCFEHECETDQRHAEAMLEYQTRPELPEKRSVQL